jgi:hypothetical protein
MAEQFSVDPGHVAGYGDLAAVTAGDCWAIGSFVLDNASSDDNFGVVMDLLRPPVDAYAEATDNRVSDRGWTLNYTSLSLEDTAWSYYRHDGGSAARFESFNPTGTGGRVAQALPGTVAYEPSTSVASVLTPPSAPEEADIEGLVEEHAGDTLGLIDEICRFVSGLVADEWSPVEAIIDPLVGNWNALKQKGEALEIAGTASETAASNLTTALTRLESHWDGGAAQSFHGYLTKLAAALDYEGALSRVVSKVYDGVAWIVEWVAIGAIKALGLGADIIRKYLPGSGWASVAWDGITGLFGGDPLEPMREDWEAAWSFFEDAKTMIELLQELPGQLEEIMGLLSDPMGALTDYAEGELEEQFEPLLETLSAPDVDVELDNAPSDILEFGSDLAEVSDVDTLTDAPADAYEPGARPNRAGG